MRAKHGFHGDSPNILRRNDSVIGVTLGEGSFPAKPDHLKQIPPLGV
jgi:hypothetical protein